MAILVLIYTLRKVVQGHVLYIYILRVFLGLFSCGKKEIILNLRIKTNKDFLDTGSNTSLSVGLTNVLLSKPTTDQVVEKTYVLIISPTRVLKEKNVLEIGHQVRAFFIV